MKHAVFSRLRALPDGERLCKRWRLPTMVVCAFGAETVASVVLCPLEVCAHTLPVTVESGKSVGSGQSSLGASLRSTGADSSESPHTSPRTAYEHAKASRDCGKVDFDWDGAM